MYALPYVILVKLRQAAIDARRRDRTWRYFALSAFAGLATGVMLSIGAMFVALLWVVGLPQFAVVAAGLMILPIVADPLARTILVPFGFYRAGTTPA